MARIRSTHPGQWTDEEFVSVSFPARLLALAVRNEADDNGIFEWKPTTLKMRLFAADSVDVQALLAEIERANLVRKFTVGASHFGAIRNFRKYQRPKKPNSTHPIPTELRTYVYLDKPSSEPVEDSDDEDPAQVLPETGNQPADGGGRRGDSVADATGADAPPAEPPSEQDLVWGDGLTWLAESAKKPAQGLRSLVGRWCKVYGDAHVLGAMTEARSQSPPVVEPVAWIEQCLKIRNQSNGKHPRQGRKPSAHEAMFAAAADLAGVGQVADDQR